MQVSDALVAFQVSVYEERITLADFVRSSGPVRDGSAVVREEAAGLQRSLEESERTLQQAVRGAARTEDEFPEVRRDLRRRAAISLAEKSSDPAV
ncbi:hypothetical protein ABZ401_01910 [Streptomyces sp. NPDC005892]|uniref:hypothetical protein n=1 Tax=Streptomyces sp. NPDC005892 TaxID=3155593 RepID=UPI0033C2B9F2